MVDALPLIKTKLHRPPLLRDLVKRPRLTGMLGIPPQQPLTLVSAPAGYGKSILISCWAEAAAAQDWPVAWISLDKYDNDPAIFLNYVVAATQSLFPDACSGTVRVLQAADLPNSTTLAAILINDLSNLPRPFSLVIDDYHLLHHVDVLQLMRLVIEQSPANLNLAIISRSDPFLPLPRLRLSQQMAEIRERDLRFSDQEAYELLLLQMATNFDEITAVQLNQRVEGWVAGLCLLAMSGQRYNKVSSLVRDFPGGARNLVTEYLITEVLAKQTPEVQQLLLRSAFVERFCADLCDALVVSASRTPAQKLIEEIEQSNLFVVTLDQEAGWYRYHHLFRQMLQQRAYRELGAEEIRELHNRAGHWFAQQGLVDEALNYFLTSQNMTAAVVLIEENSRNLLNNLERRVLEHWLDLLPDDIVWQRPRLLMAKAWLFYRHWRLQALASVLDQLQHCLTQNSSNLTTSERQFIMGQMQALQSATFYVQAGEHQKSMVAAKKALSYLPVTEQGALGTAMGYLALSLQALGNEEIAIAHLQQAIDDPAPLGPASIQLYLGLSFVYWAAGNLGALAQTVGQFMAFSRKNQQGTAPACWVTGIYHYEVNQLDQARSAFEETVSLHYSTNFMAACDSWLALARICQVQRDFIQAQAHLDAVRAETMRLENRELLPVIDAAQAYQWHLQGETVSALRWAREFDPQRSPEWVMLTFPPLLFWVRILAAHGEVAELRIVQQTLTSKIKQARSRHFSRLTLQLLTHQALVQMKQGDGEQAMHSLGQAVRWVQAGGFVRSIIDTGAALKPYWEHLRHQDVEPHYLDQLMVAFSQDGRGETALSAQSLEWATLLTLREKEILQLMQAGLNNTEIAQELVISLHTVKRHASNIYRKLEVNGRRQAVYKAQKMGILTLD